MAVRAGYQSCCQAVYKTARMGQANTSTLTLHSCLSARTAGCNSLYKMSQSAEESCRRYTTLHKQPAQAEVAIAQAQNSQAKGIHPKFAPLPGVILTCMTLSNTLANSVLDKFCTTLQKCARQKEASQVCIPRRCARSALAELCTTLQKAAFMFATAEMSHAKGTPQICTPANAPRVL